MGIEYSIETGVSLNKLKVWNEHVFAGFDTAKRSSRSVPKSLIRLADGISINDNLNKALRYALFKIFRIQYGIPHLIPPDLLDFFPVTENNFTEENLFDALKKSGVRIIRKEPKLSRSESSLIRNIPNLLENCDLVLFKLNSLDRLGHKYGPLSEKVKRRVQYLDGLMEELVGKLDKNTVLIVMSDHGMVPVFGTDDLTAFLEDRGYKFGRDYFAFVGATYTTFWFKSPETKQAIEHDLGTLKFGRLLTPEDRVKLGISNVGAEYGEAFFVNNEHSVSFPEFYHRRKPPAGMHGYAFCKYDSPIFLLHNGPKNSRRIDNINFVDIMPTILQLFNLPIPSYVEGRSIL